MVDTTTKAEIEVAVVRFGEAWQMATSGLGDIALANLYRHRHQRRIYRPSSMACHSAQTPQCEQDYGRHRYSHLR
jgi:hypothetical protein